MIWAAPTRDGSGCAKLDVRKRSNFREEQSDEDYDCWHRLGKAILQRSWVDAHGKVKKKACVALAAKSARTIWALLAKGEPCRSPATHGLQQ